jgi:hypothetical protein
LAWVGAAHAGSFVHQIVHISVTPGV